MVFDILYLDSVSVINRTLTERHELLRQTLGPQQTTAIPVGAGPHLSCRLAYSSPVACATVSCSTGSTPAEVDSVLMPKPMFSRAGQGGQGRRGS